MAGLRWAGICCAGRGGDIQPTWPKAHVTETPSSGYRYRAHIRRNAGGKAIAEAVTDIDYIKLQEQD
jgi:L-aminopeptidase/D-esterase-like protein